MKRSLFLLVIGCSIVLGALAFLIPPRHANAGPLVERLLSATSRSTPFAAVLPGLEWDMVCYLDPYSFPSRRLPAFLDTDMSGFEYRPSDEWIGEEENSLAFIDQEAKVVHVYPVERRVIRQISGPRCLNNEFAFFMVEDIQAPNIAYKRLTLVPHN